MFFLKKTIVALALTCLFSCNLEKKKPVVFPVKYLDGAQKFDISEFYNNKSCGFAIVLSNNGDIIDKITIAANGEWGKDRGVIKFNYIYNDNRKESRTWLITKSDDKNFSIVGHDFAGNAKGRQSGNAAEIIYNMNYKLDNQPKEIKFVDNLYLIDKNSLIIRSDLHHNQKRIGKIISSLSKGNHCKSPVNNTQEDLGEVDTSKLKMKKEDLNKTNNAKDKNEDSKNDAITISDKIG